MNVNNLTNVYNQNPTLQGQYTLQQYLDLYGGSSTGTTTPTTTTTTTPTTNASQGIINAGINQYQNQGGGNDQTGFGAFGNLDESTAKTEYRDVSDGKGGSTIEKFTTYMDSGGMRKTIDGKNVTHGGINAKPLAISLFNALTGKKEYKGEYPEKGKTLGTFSNRPEYKNLGIFAKLKYDYNRNKELKQYGIELQKQKELKAQIEADRLANLSRQQYNEIGRRDYSGEGQAFQARTDTFTGGKTVSSPSTPGGKYSSPRKDGGLVYAQGGRVGAKDGGSMTQIVKDRLMDKNPAMWGIGYEGLASLQDLIMSMPFNQGGIVNIRRR